MSGTWSWRRLGSPWSVFAAFGEQQTRNTGFASLSGWQTSAGTSANLNPHTTVSIQYVYLNSTGTYLGAFNHLAVQSVRLSLGWAPQTVQR
jgi:opacity protein-like surface antigen